MKLEIYNPKEDGFIKSIDWNFEDLKKEITVKANDYLNLVYDNNQIKEAKKDRAALRKFITALEDKRKELKKQVLAPYQEFEKQEKELVEILNDAVSNIDGQVKEYEEKARQDKLDDIKVIYAEEIPYQDLISFDKIFKDSWLNATTSIKSIQKDMQEIGERVSSDLNIIEADSSDYKFEMKEEYLKNYDLAAAMAKKVELEDNAKKKALFEEQQKKEAEEKERKLQEEAQKVALAGTQVTEDKPAEDKKEKVLSITFKVTANESQFADVNNLINQLKQCSEHFEIIKQEEK